MIGNINDLMNIFQQLQANPMQILSQKFNIPQGMDTSNPNNIIQHLLNTGQVSQTQINNMMQMKNNPFIQRLFNNR